MVILSIDPSTTASGYAVFKDEKLVEYGVWKQDGDKEYGRFYRHQRIVYMVQKLQEVAIKYHVDKIIAEAPPPAINNSETVLALGNLQGALLWMATNLNIPIEFIEVSTWHSALQILKSKGDLKQQSIKIANEQYGLELIYKAPKSKRNQSDEADAICIAYYYLNKRINNDFKIISRR